MSTEIARLHATIGADTSGFQQGLGGVRGALIGAGAAVTEFGINAAASFVQNGVSSVLEFDKSLKNIQAVTGDTSAGIANLSKDLLAIGGSSVAGPQAVADAYYDIAGGVADTSVRMATLNAAIATSEAGNASLGATTKGLISVMNAYGFSADQAGMVSDVFTQTVGKGVGTMDEFVAAMSPLGGLTASVGMDFSELGANMAFMTTKGTSAAQSATQIKAAVTSLLNPNKEMEKALKAIGVASGSAAIEQYGLAGTLEKLKESFGGNTDAMSTALGSVEALQASVALTDDSYAGFLTTFEGTMGGVTEAARKVQLQGVTAQLDIMKNQFGAIGIEAGTALLPAFNAILGGVNQFIQDVKTKGLGPALEEWFNKGIAWLRDTAPSVFRGVVSGAINLAGDVMTWVKTNAPNIAAGITDWFNNGIAWLQENAPKAFDEALHKGLQLGQDIINFVKANAPDVVAGFKDWFGTATNWLINEAPKAFDAALHKGLQLGQDIINFVKTNAPDIGAGINSWITDAVNWLVAEDGGIGLLKSSVGTLLNFTGDIAGFVLDHAPDLTFAVGGWVRGAIHWLTNDAPKLLLTAIQSLFAGPKIDTSGMAGGDIAADMFAGLQDTSFLDGALEGIMNSVMKIFGPEGAIFGLFDGLFGLEKGTLGKAVMGFFTSSEPGSIGGAIKDGKKWIEEFIKKVDDIKTGFTNAFKGVVDIMTKPFREVLDYVGKILIEAGKAGGVFEYLGKLGQDLRNAAGIQNHQYAAPIGPGMARGGKVNAGVAQVVGEYGPEIFTPDSDGSIITANETRGMAMPVAGENYGGGRGGGTVYVTQNVSGMTDGRELVEMVITELKRRNGNGIVIEGMGG